MEPRKADEEEATVLAFDVNLMRYLYSLECKDLGLNTAMIPLGSCVNGVSRRAAPRRSSATWRHGWRL